MTTSSYKEAGGAPTEGAPGFRVALVTGGSSGLGLAIAERLLADGFSVAVVSRSGEGLGSAHTPMLSLQYDLTEAGAPEKIVRDVVERFGRLDVLVNNAGRRHAGMIVDNPRHELEEVLQLNTIAAMEMTGAAARVMTKQRDGAIINLVSRLATIGVPTLSTYSASKGALLAYTRAAAVELAPDNIRVNAVAPGMALTPLIEDWLTEQADPEQALAQVVNAIPLGRLASPEDVAGAVSYLASNDARYITGISIPVDGGYTAQ